MVLAAKEASLVHKVHVKSGYSSIWALEDGVASHGCILRYLYVGIRGWPMVSAPMKA